MLWKEDGLGQWRARIDGIREAHISATESGFQAWMSLWSVTKEGERTGSEKGRGVLGTYPTLEIAKIAFEPNGKVLSDELSVAHHKAVAAGMKGA